MEAALGGNWTKKGAIWVDRWPRKTQTGAPVGRGMQNYPVRPGHAAKTDLKMLFEAAFDSYIEKDGWITGKFGTLLDIKVKYEGKKEFIVDTVTDKQIAIRMAKGDDSAMVLAKDTQSRWNDFLEGATGYDAKQRSKKIQEAAKKEAKSKA